MVDISISRSYFECQMSMSLDALIGELQCPVCLDLFDRPIILPCSHVLCHDPCAMRLFHRDFIRCPICRDTSFVTGGLDNLPRVISLENIIQNYRDGLSRSPTPLVFEDDFCQENDIPCQLCDDTSQPRRACHSCLDCNASYCKVCIQISHPPKSPFSDHKLVKPKKYPKPREIRCPQHDIRVNIYCIDCQKLACLLCADDSSAHPTHQILSIEEATKKLRSDIESLQKRSECGLNQFIDAIRNRQDKLQECQQAVEANRAQIHNQCDTLINDIEIKREFFLSDLEHEERKRSDKLTQKIERLQQKSSSLQSALHFAREAIKETEALSFIQLAVSVIDKLNKNMPSTDDTTALRRSLSDLSSKTVDLRKERAFIKDITYLSVPTAPCVDIEKCSRSSNSVLLILTPPRDDTEIIDGYKIYFSSISDENLTEQIPKVFATCGSFYQNTNSICLIQSSLNEDTQYYFCVKAFNASGESEVSAISCFKTLSQSAFEEPVADIVLSQSRTYTHSIHILCSDFIDLSVDPNISYYILYRNVYTDMVWRIIPMYGRLDHRVFGLDSDTKYEFITKTRKCTGECILSRSIYLTTESLVISSTLSN